MKTKDTRHFESLDGLRGVAALMVLLGHASALFLKSVWVPRKLLAVQFFFMLSGFVISYAYEEKLRAGMSWREFMLRRVIRLYPLIVLSALIGFASYAAFRGLHHPGAMSARVVCGVIDVPCLVIRGGEDQSFALNPPAWSLFFEMAAYVLYAGVLSRFTTLAIGVLAALLAPPSIFADITFGDHIPFVWHTADSLMSYSIGVLLFRWRRNHYQAGASPNALILGVPLALLVLLPRSIGWWPDLVATFIMFPALILLGSFEAPVLQERKVTRFLGQISYPIYIIHWPVLILTLVAFRSAASSNQMVMGIIAALGFAWAVLKTYDEPIRRWLSKRTS